MKKIILLTGLLAISIAYTTSCKGNNWDRVKSSGANLLIDGGKDTFSINGENTIDLAYDFVLPSMVYIYTANAVQDIEINTGAGNVPIVSVAIQTLRKSDMETLYQQAITFKPAAGVHYITAVEIFYGINSTTHNLTYYFLPVCLQAVTPGTPPAIYTYVPTDASLSNTNFYTYNSAGSMVLATTAQLADTSNYINAIEIQHYAGAPPRFNNEPYNSPDSSADTKYVIFPFQEIFSMFEQNSVSSLTLYNIAVPVTVQGGEYYAKHSLLLSPPSGGSSSFSINEDLGHMVPPDYGNISYPVLQ